jgi:hypothetical protein
MVVSGGIRAQQDLNLRKMLPQIPEDFPDQATEFEILHVLTYPEDTSWGFTCGVKSPKFFSIASILPAFWRNRGLFFYLRKKLSPVIRTFGMHPRD